MTPLTVACVWVRGNVDYTPEYVTRLRAMVAAFAGQPHRFVCLTDRPENLPSDLETVRIRAPHGCAGWWAKIQLFDPAHGWTGRVLSLDLDTLVVAPLIDIIGYPSSFALVPDAGTFQPRNGLRVIKRFNSSVMVWDAGTERGLYTSWTPEVADYLWGDQDWIGEQRPSADVMPLQWFPRLSQLRDGVIPTEATVVLCKKPKNAEAAQRWPWFAERWSA